MENVTVEEEDYSCFFCQFFKKIEPHFQRQGSEEELQHQRAVTSPVCSNRDRCRGRQGNGEQRRAGDQTKKKKILVGPHYEIDPLTHTNLSDFLATISQILSLDKITQLRTGETAP